jgi:S-adenosylhomocysteine hydrolase
MSAPASKFKVADLSLAAFGRKEIELAEVCLLSIYKKSLLSFAF